MNGRSCWSKLARRKTPRRAAAFGMARGSISDSADNVLSELNRKWGSIRACSALTSDIAAARACASCLRTWSTTSRMSATERPCIRPACISAENFCAGSYVCTSGNDHIANRKRKTEVEAPSTKPVAGRMAKRGFRWRRKPATRPAATIETPTAIGA